MEENGNSGSQGGGGSGGGSPGGWVEGGPVESMSADQARSEIKAIERDSRFAGKGAETQGFLDRKAMLDRRWSLYQKAGPEDPERPSDINAASMYDSLKQQGITKESLEKKIEGFEERDAKEAMDSARSELESRLGGKEPAAAVVKTARSIVKKYASTDDQAWIAESGLGNDPDFILAIGEVGRMLEAKREELRLSKKRRKS